MLGGVTFNVLVQEKATVLDLKKRLPTPASYLKNISLVYKGKELPDFMSLQQLEFSDSDFLVVVFNKKRYRETKDKELQKKVNHNINSTLLSRKTNNKFSLPYLSKDELLQNLKLLNVLHKNSTKGQLILHDIGKKVI